jgi:hypothetical protein
VAPAAEQARWHLERPLDRHLTPLEAITALRAGGGGTGARSGRPLQESMVLLDRAREAKDAGVRSELLATAAARLQELPVGLRLRLWLGDGLGLGLGLGLRPGLRQLLGCGSCWL